MSNHWIKPNYNDKRFGFEVTMYVNVVPMHTKLSNVSASKGVRAKRRQGWKSVGLGMAFLLPFALAEAGFANASSADTNWPFFNYNQESTGFTKKSGDLNVKEIKKRGLRLKARCGNNISTQAPVVVTDGVGYFATRQGSIIAFDIHADINSDSCDASTLGVKWEISVPNYISPRVSQEVGFDVLIESVKGSPVVVGDLLVFGGRNNRQFFGLSRDTAGNPAAIGPCGKPVIGALGNDGCAPDQGFNLEKGLGIDKQGGAFAFAVNKNTGAFVWATQLDDDRLSVVTASPMVGGLYGDTVFIGTSSAQNFINMSTIRFTGLNVPDIFQLLINGQTSTIPYAYEVPAVSNPPSAGYYLGNKGLVVHDSGFQRGAVIALEAATGRIKSKTYMTPGSGTDPSLDGEFSGASVWGNMTYDKARDLLYIPTGQNMSSSQFSKDCEIQRRAGNALSTACINVNKFPLTKKPETDNHGNSYTVYAQGNYPDSIVAMKSTGEIAWNFTPYPYDTWTNDCAVWDSGLDYSAPNAHCPYPIGLDNDFGMGPALVGNELVAINKAGQIYVLNPANGSVLRKKGVGVLSTDGNTKWGFAVDKKHIFLTSSIQPNVGEEGILNLQAPVGGFKHKLCHSYNIPSNYASPRTAPVDERQSTGKGKCRISPSVAAGVTEATSFLLTSVKLSDLKLHWQYTSPVPSFYQGGVSGVSNLIMVADYAAFPDGTFRVLSKKNGKSIWTYSGVNQPNMKPTVSDGIILWTSGYFFSGTGGVYSFELCPVGTKVSPTDQTICVPQSSSGNEISSTEDDNTNDYDDYEGNEIDYDD